MRFSREKKFRLFIEVIVLLSLGLALGTRASNVAAPTPAQHLFCEPFCTTYYPIGTFGPYCGDNHSGTVYRAAVDSASADRQTYGPGDTMTVSGTVEVQSYTYYYNFCGCYNPNQWVPVDPATGSVVLELWMNSDWKAVSSAVTPDPSGNFVLTYQVPSNQPHGPLSFRVTVSPQPSYGANACSPLQTPFDSLGHKSVQVSIQTTPVSTVYSSTSATPTVASTTPSTTSSSSQEVYPPPTNVCDPALTIVMLIITVIVTLLIVIVLTRWIIRRLPFRTRLIIAIVVVVLVWFFLGAVLILGPDGICVPAIIWLLAIIVILIVIVLFRNWLIGPPLPPPPPPPPPPWPQGRLPPNVTGNATLTQPNGNQTRLTNKTVKQITHGSKIETGNHSFVRMQTPQGSNSHTTIGENSSLNWLDPKTYLPWLKLPAESLANIERLLLQPNSGKLLLNWIESGAAKEALLVLPTGLIGTAAAAATGRWLARVKGTKLLVEATQDGTAAAITVLEDPAGPSSVELWRSDETGKVIEIHSGERVVLKTGSAPAKMRVNLSPGLEREIEDPFNVMHRWWTLPSATDESFSAIGTMNAGPNLSTRTKTGVSSPPPDVFCNNCGQPLPKPNSRFCTKCGAEQSNANSAGKCTKCGEPFRPGKKFCIKCGAPQS